MTSPIFESVTDLDLRSPALEAEVQIDFTGGLVERPGSKEIETNQVRGALNVDFYPEGGLGRRRPFNWRVTPLATGAQDQAIVEYRRPDGVSFFMRNTAYELIEVRMVNPVFQIVNHGVVLNGFEPIRGVQVGDLLYLVSTGPWKIWDGTNFLDPRFGTHSSATIPDFSTYELLGIPVTTGGDIQEWNGRLWQAAPAPPVQGGAYTYTGTDPAVFTPAGGLVNEPQPESVWFSYPFGIRDREGPEDWYELHILRLDESSGDSVVALTPFADRLYAFMRNSVHSISPHYEEPAALLYTTDRVASSVGAVGQYATAATGTGLWFFDGREGLHEIRADGAVVSHGDPVKGLMSRLNRSHIDRVVVAEIESRIWVSVPTGTSTVNNETYVYDPRIAAWTRYSVGFENFFRQEPVTSANTEQPTAWYGLYRDPITGGMSFLQLEQDGNFNFDDAHDRLRASAVDTEFAEIDSFVETAWFDGGFPEADKKWHGAEFFFRTQEAQPMTVTHYTNWDEFYQEGQHTIADAANPAVYENALAAVPTYLENNVFEAATSERRGRWTEVEDRAKNNPDPTTQGSRIGALTNGRSVSFRIEPVRTTKALGGANADNPVKKFWALDRMTLFFSRKNLRI